MKIDCHAHYVPAAVLERVRKEVGSLATNLARRIEAELAATDSE